MKNRLAEPFWLISAGYCLAALALDWLSNIGLYRGLGVTPWTPASGLALAFAYLFGLRTWLPLAIAEALVLLVTNQASFSPFWTVILVVTNTAILLATSNVLRAHAEFDPRLASVQSLLKLIYAACLLAAASSAIYVAALWLNDRINQFQIYPVLWRLVVGHLVGVLIVAPLPLMLHSGWRWPRLTPVRASQVIVLFAALWIIFNYRAATTYQLFYLLFIPLLWIAISDGIGGAAIMLNIAQVGIIAGAQMRTEIVPSTGSLQLLMIALALTGLLIGAVVSDRQSAGQRLRDQHAALGRALRLRSAGETAAAISHQINQPITAISTYAAVAQDALNSGNLDLARTSLAKLSEECDRAASVSRSIRDLVKQGSLSAAPIRLIEVIQSVRSTHAAECAANQISFEVDVPSTLPTVFADPVQLEQALDNLVTNSIEAIREARRGSRVKISAISENAETRIDVEDDGPGFAPGLDALVTTPFMTTKPNGSGLGLAIARSVAEAHGGSLSIIRRNSGAMVRLSLPNNERVS